MGNKSPHASAPPSRRVSERAATYANPPIAGGTSIASALFTNAQRRVLGLLFGHPGESYSVSQVITAAGMGSGAIQRELARLAASGLVTIREVGNQRHYQANPATPVFSELVALIRKTVAFADPLRQALAPYLADIDLAFVFGSTAKQTDTARSDIDLLIVSDTLSYSTLFGALETASQTLGRPINPTLMTGEEFTQRRDERQAFLTRVLEQPKIWLKGSDDDLAA